MKHDPVDRIVTGRLCGYLKAHFVRLYEFDSRLLFTIVYYICSINGIVRVASRVNTAFILRVNKNHIIVMQYSSIIITHVFSRRFELSVERHIHVDAGVGDKLRAFLRKLGILHVNNAVAELHER